LDCINSRLNPIFTLYVREQYHKKTENQAENSIKHFLHVMQAKNKSEVWI
jgi:hypothetical protein